MMILKMKNKNKLFSDEYDKTLEIYKKLHTEGTQYDSPENTFDGKSLRFFFNPIRQVIELTNSKSIIDFGCGKAKFYNEEITISNIKYKNISKFWKIDDYFLYDPGVEKYSEYPSKNYDGVICVDVVEHIPETDVNEFVDELFNLANKFVFIVIACYPAKKTLPDGRNVHLSIKTVDEWKKIIKEIRTKYKKISPYVICSTNRNSFVTVS